MVPGKRVHRMHSATFGFALIVSTAACYGGSFHCETNDQCAGNGLMGICQADHFCSFGDITCPSGQRYGDSSGASSGQCVGGAGGEAGVDGEPGVDAQLCFGGALTVCLTMAPTMPLTLPPTVNTDTDCQQVVDQTNGLALCVLAGSVVTVDMTRASGSRPLVVIAATALTINNALDVSSNAGTTGAAANSTDCAATNAMNGDDDQGGGGGGAGASFATSGASGGHGDDNNNGLPVGQAPGGNSNAMQTPSAVRGGCRGGNGGSAGLGGGSGGDGGGAMYLIAGHNIAINGGAFASGSGGAAGPSCGGGGGGGTGGLIGLDAPTIDISGEVAANGGAGGGGGGTSNAGQRGGDGTTTAYDQKATGGSAGTTGGGPGGDGTTLGTLNGEAGTKGDCGGGGGGGGVGYVWVHGTVNGNRISPTPTMR
ncbi:MAG TPA: hypothetical protein VFQ80_08535 [Thermomicrobiales bacterium]|jgi:hypothetical protein|nr:hypothetical protein [Thermomicrobiales bacterium]